MLISSWLSNLRTIVSAGQATFGGKTGRRRTAARSGNSAASPHSQRIAETLESRELLTINVAVVQDIGGGNNSGFVATVNQLNDDTYFDFGATLVNSSQVDTAGELAAYDVVVVGNNGYSQADAFNNLPFQAALRTWVETSGGGVVMTGWGIFGNQDNTRTDIDAVIPVNLMAGYNYYQSNTSISLNTSHPITAGIGSSLPITSSGGEFNYVEYSGGSLDSGATSLGTIGGNSVLAAAQKGSGRGVYLGPIYSGSFGYGNATLRSGAADRLLEQAVAWAATSTSVTDVINVSPDPRNSAVNTIDVTFSGAINGATFDYNDVTLTRNGGPNLSNASVSVSLLSGNTYRISNLAPLTATGGNIGIR